MKVSILASTNPGYKLTKDEALKFGGKSAGICYMQDDIEALFSEPEEKTIRRANMTLNSGHHSVFDHTSYNLALEGIPKILAMILNNEGMYTTSEKSARYTKMQPSEQEKNVYEKWIEIYKKEISKVYPQIDEKKVKKLAQENARYLISVFTPATVMEYTTNFCQLNYIINWAKDYIEKEENNSFSIKLKKVLEEFLKSMPDIEVEGLDTTVKKRSFSLFSKREHRTEEFGENYCTTYLASFAELAQAQRHRTLNYEMTLLKEPKYYVPPIIRNTEYENEWIKDISSLKDFYPQGMLVKVNERGTIENFALKCTERLCGCAQLEIMEQTEQTMHKYIEAVKENKELYEYLLPYSKGARCTFPGWKCTAPCIFGGKNAMNRKI